jgi:hypothetical protein
VSFYSHNSFLFKAILRLGGNRYQQQCDDIKEKSFGNSDKDILTELRNIEKANDPIPKGLKEHLITRQQNKYTQQSFCFHW